MIIMCGSKALKTSGKGSFKEVFLVSGKLLSFFKLSLQLLLIPLPCIVIKFILRLSSENNVKSALGHGNKVIKFRFHFHLRWEAVRALVFFLPNMPTDSGEIPYKLCQLAFCYCDEISEAVDLKEERLILTPVLRGFSPQSVGSIAFRLVMRQNIMATGAYSRGDCTTVVARKQRKWARKRGALYGR